MSSALLTHPYAKVATNGVALLSFLIVVPHTAIPIPFEHARVQAPPAEAAVLHPNAAYFSIPGTVMLSAGATAIDSTGRLSLLVNRIGENEVNVTLSYHNCTQNYCIANAHVPMRTALALGNSVHYAGRSIQLVSITADSATFALRN